MIFISFPFFLLCKYLKNNIYITIWGKNFLPFIYLFANKRKLVACTIQLTEPGEWQWVTIFRNGIQQNTGYLPETKASNVVVLDCGHGHKGQLTNVRVQCTVKYYRPHESIGNQISRSDLGQPFSCYMGAAVPPRTPVSVTTGRIEIPIIFLVICSQNLVIAHGENKTHVSSISMTGRVFFDNSGQILSILCTL